MRSRRRITILGAAWVLAVATIGCGGYGTMSPAAYEYTMALYSITNRQTAEPLEAIRAQVEAARSSGEVSTQEAQWLLGIVDRSASGEWKAANRQCRAMMEEQVQAK